VDNGGPIATGPPNVACVERPATARKKALARSMGKARLSTRDGVIQIRGRFMRGCAVLDAIALVDAVMDRLNKDAGFFNALR
jgi:hypothetical protein